MGESSMQPKDVVRRAIEFDSPPRVPIHYHNGDLECSDTLGTGYAPAPGFAPSRPGETEWGFVWHSLNQTMGQPHIRPLADWSAIDTYRPPDPHAPGRLDHVSAWAAEHSDRFLRFGLGITGFNCATFLRGFEEFLVDLRAAPDRVERVLDIVHGFENAIIDEIGAYPVDAVTFADDWGSQNGLIIAPDLWRRVFKPRYADQFARIHRAGKKVWFHSCGDVYSIIGDLIEIGADVLEFLQPDLLGVERLAADFGGNVCFCCSVDHQRVAIAGSRDEIFAYARRLYDMLGAFNGGFIAYIEDYSCLGMSQRNYQWLREAFHGLSSM